MTDTSERPGSRKRSVTAPICLSPYAAGDGPAVLAIFNAPQFRSAPGLRYRITLQ
jgi:hypothetical protein